MLTKQIPELQQRISRVKTATQKLLGDKTATKLKFKEKSSILLADLKKLSDDFAVMKNEVNQKRHQYNNLKQLKDEILKKRQNYDEFKLKLETLENEMFKEANKIALMQEFLDDSKAKRCRYSVSSTVSTKT